jgi:hypothetical protein
MKVPVIGNVSLGTGLVVGAAAVFLAPVVIPIVTGVLKSLTKSGIKGGLILYEKGKITMEEARESVEDLAAEAKAELSQSKEARATTPRKKVAAAS